MNSIAKTDDHQGFIVLTEKFIYRKQFFDSSKNKLIVAIDKIQDPRNLGALIRSAYCTNIMGIIITDNETCSISGSVFKSSAGFAEYIDIIKVSSMANGLELAKKNGYSIYPSFNKLFYDGA